MAADFPEEIRTFRETIANAMLRGAGVEIGPGNIPIRFSDPSIRPTYVDFATKKELIEVHGYPQDWQEPDLVEDGSILPSIALESINFLIACHVLEHTQDPVKVLNNWLSKLTAEGVLFLAIPHRDYCFDRNRPLTEVAHLFDDYYNSVRSEREHLLEWCVIVNGMTDENEINRSIDELKRIDYRIHYHVWNTDSFLSFLLEYRKRMVDFEIEFYGRNVTEIVAVLRKRMRL